LPRTKGFCNRSTECKIRFAENVYPKHFVDTTGNKFGKKNHPSTQSKEAYTVFLMSRAFQTSLNVLGINITLRPF
jgi:hypothetical protein